MGNLTELDEMYVSLIFLFQVYSCYLRCLFYILIINCGCSDLQDNNFTGSIPESFFDLTHLLKL